MYGAPLSALARALDRWKKLAEPWRTAAREAIARVAAKPDLSNDVREVVSQLRDEDEIDLGSALHSLIEGVPAPKIVMEMPDDFRVEDARRAHVLLRCTQEILTNTIERMYLERGMIAAVGPLE